jgi:hypothetical protein
LSGSRGRCVTGAPTLWPGSKNGASTPRRKPTGHVGSAASQVRILIGGLESNMTDDEPLVLVEKLIQDVGGGRFYLRLSFSTVTGGRGTLLVPREHIARPSRVVEELLRKGARLPSLRADAAKIVSDALADTETLSPEKGSSTTGWCGRTFVLPEKSIGPEQIYFLGVAEAESSLGSLAAWNSRDLASDRAS